MGWFLMRKPYPGLAEPERIDIKIREVFLGRGRENTVICLSMFVSRVHLSITLKLDGSIWLKDLGSSNGTYINQQRVDAQVEHSLSVGDEIGLGNVSVENSDCFVYIVHQDSSVQNLPLLRIAEGKQCKQPKIMEPEVVDLTDDEDSSKETSKKQVDMEEPPKGLTECGDEKPTKSDIPVTPQPGCPCPGPSKSDISVTAQPGRPCPGPSKSDISVTAQPGCPCPGPSKSDMSVTPQPGCPCPGPSKSDISVTAQPGRPCPGPSKSDISVTAQPGCPCPGPSKSDMSVTPQPGCPCPGPAKSDISVTAQPGHPCPGPSKSDMSVTPQPGPSKLDVSVTPQQGRPCPAPTLLVNRRLSTLIGDSCDSSAGTLKLSSLSTPTKLHFSGDEYQLTTSTPCNVSKKEEVAESPLLPAVNGDFSPIAKTFQNSESSANYTLDEEVVELSDDDDDDIFPCSQMFAEEDVKPSIKDLKENSNLLIDLSEEEEGEPQGNMAPDEEDIVIISSGEEEEEDEDASRWFKRLSQCSVKVEKEEERNADERLPSGCNVDREFEELEQERNMKRLKLEAEVADSKKLEIKDERNTDFDKLIVDFKESEEKKRNEDLDFDKLLVDSKEFEEKKRKEDFDQRKDKRFKGKDRTEKMRERDKDKDKRKHRDDGEKKRKRKSDSDKPEKLVKEARFDEIKERLRDTFGDSDSDLDAGPSLPREKQSKKTGHSCSMLDKKDSDSSESKILVELKDIRVSVEKLEDDQKLCERYNVPSSSSPSTSVSPPKKNPRRIELMDALPNPSRRAKNRGISGPSAMKIYEGRRSSSDSREERRNSSDSKLKEKSDTKALIKEKLAEVAFKQLSKKKSSSESKRVAPAKIKVTSCNRGSFLTDGDEVSPASKPKSRKEVLSKMKIPKVRNDKVVNLPTKSPLQEMNMSWEKDSPKDIPSASVTAPAALPKAVEIPTGPQPKKRIAKRPPPGFYEPNSVPSTIAPHSGFKSVDLKSCIGDTKKSKEYQRVLKKRVKFKENLEEVFYIEKLPGTRRLGSSKDADRPKALSGSKPKIHRPVEASDEAVLQDVIYDVSKWNPIWLKEEKNLPPDQPPPVVSNMNLPTVPKTQFLDFDEYNQTMYPLLMLNLWTSVSKDFNAHTNDSRSNMMMAVDSATSSPVLSRPDRLLTTLYCHVLVNKRNENFHPRLGNLVIVDLALKDSGNSKPSVVPVFGYVSFDTKERLHPNVKFHKDLVNYCPEPVFKVRFFLLIRERKNCNYVLDRPMRVKNVTYVRGDLRVFQALHNLQHLPLRYSVISPSAANEDFTLPDASMKELFFGDSLNPTQEKVVLQTAEVCLQDKPKICLIQGPPGTGKSQVILSLVMQLLYRDGMYTRANRERGLVPRILLCAPSNNAIDVLVKRLLVRRQTLEQQNRFKMVRVGQPQNMHPDVKGISLKELAMVDMKNQSQGGGDLQTDIASIDAKMKGVENIIRDLTLTGKAVPPDLSFRQADYLRKRKVLEERLKQQSSEKSPQQSKANIAIEREAMKKLLKGADIVATTLTSCLIKVMETTFPPPARENHYHFGVCIIDEATQCLEVETLIPLMLGVKTLVLVGDPNQLPATILSKVAQEKGLGTSLFSRLMKTVPHAVQSLNMQYRMHPEILKWPNMYFYRRVLQTPQHVASRRDSQVLPYAVLSLPYTQDPRGEANIDEANLVLTLAELLIEKKVINNPEFRIGIVTPYQAQRRILLDLQEKYRRIPHVEINTIDSFQGQEKDVIIMSCVRTKGVGFMADRQRLNVALTRAKYALFICGNFSSLDRDNMWSSLLTDARHRKCFLQMDREINPSNREELWNVIRKK